MNASKLLKNNNILSLTGNFTAAVFGFLSFVLLTRVSTADIFGKWVLFITASTFIEMFRFGITRVALVKFLSGAPSAERRLLIGSNWLIGIVITIAIAMVVFAINFLFKTTISQSGFVYFFKWYPILAFVNLPFNNALTILQADMKFMKILVIRLFNTGSFVAFLVLELFWLKWTIESVVLVYICINALTSLLTLLLGWDYLKLIRYVDKSIVKKLLNFGKYSLGTLVGTNLLKSADTFIIGLSPILGTTGVALYSIPLKMTEILEVPLRSFVATFFPKIAKAHRDHDTNQLRSIFYTYAGSLTILFIPFLFICLLLAPQIIIVLGGAQYLSALPIYYIFCIYGMFLPIDRFTGVALDGVNKPNLNFYKVIAMASVNIVGDLIAVFWFKSILGVSIVTIAMTIVGVFVGFFQLNKVININLTNLFKIGFQAITSNIIKK